jgi:hypothetical protein
MKTEYIQQLILMVQRLNSNCNEIGPGMMAQMKSVADEANKEVEDIVLVTRHSEQPKPLSF